MTEISGKLCGCGCGMPLRPNARGEFARFKRGHTLRTPYRTDVVERPCGTCGVAFRPRTDQAGAYCSARCARTSITQRRHWTPCETCGAPIAAPPSHKRRFCSADCVGRGQRWLGKGNPKFQGGIWKDNATGRWYICCRDRTQVAYYRGVMAAHVGRLPYRWEDVHHINENPSDDRIENLMLLSHEDHARLHGFGPRWGERA